MKPEAFVRHRTPSRLRLKIPSRREDVEYFEAMVREFSGIPRFGAVSANPRAASVLFEAPSLDVEAVLMHGDKSGFFKSVIPPPIRLSLGRKVAAPIGKLDDDLRRATGDELDLKSAAFIMFLLMGAIQVLSGNLRLPPWYSAFWYAFGIFSKTLMDDLDNTVDGDGGEDGD